MKNGTEVIVNYLQVSVAIDLSCSDFLDFISLFTITWGKFKSLDFLFIHPCNLMKCVP